MKAKTDQGPSEENTPMPDYIQNLFDLMKLVSNEELVRKYQLDYAQCQIRYGDMKKQLAEDMVDFIRPIRDKAIELQKDEDTLRKIMKAGKDKARDSASKTLEEARKAMGINFYC
jgi:tryptophanyl-tRNA synthetase